MQINYRIKLKNPIVTNLNVSASYIQTGEFTVEKKSTGILIKGSVTKNNDIVKAYNHSYLGEDYSLTENDSLNLKTTDYLIADIEEVFDALSTTVDSEEFRKIQPYLRKVVKTVGSYKVDVYVEKSTDVFILKVNKEGRVTGFKGFVQPFSNTVKVDASEEILASDTLLYILTSKPLKLHTDDYMFIPLDDLVRCPQGFCTITNQVYHKSSNSFETFEGYSTLASIEETPLMFTTETLVDGVKLSKTSLKAKEKVVIQPSEGYSKLTLNNLEDNITLIYEVTPENNLQPYLAVVGKDLDLEYNSNINERLDSLKQADSEFHKKYLCKEYKTLVSTKHNQYSIFNSDVLELLLNTNEFLGCILKYEQ